MKKVFLSYSWKNEETANRIDYLCKKEGITIIRDKRDLKYRQSIKEFMKQISNSDYVIMLISEHYLKSENCMYEVLEFIKSNDFKNRIIPLIHENTNIFNTIGRIDYIKYWEDEYIKLKEKAECVSREASIEISNEIKKVNNIKNSISEFIDVISDMSAIIYEKDISNDEFKEIKKIINGEEFYYLLNIPRTRCNPYKTMVWIKRDEQGYVDRLSEAHKYTKDEVNKTFKNEFDLKKFTAVPLNDVLSKFRQDVIPFSGEFYKGIRDNKDKLIGNKSLYLNEEDIRNLI